MGKDKNKEYWNFHAYAFAEIWGFLRRYVKDNMFFVIYVRRGMITKSEGKHILDKPIEYSQELLDEVLRRLSINEEDLNKFITAPIKSWHQFNTYKPSFEKTEIM